MGAGKMSTLRAGLALLCLAAWLVLSNHCALADVFGRTGKGGCPRCAHESPRKPAPVGVNDCCKQLKVTPEAAVSFRPAMRVPLTLAFLPMALLAPPAAQALPEMADTGPPPVPWFAEIVLQQSLRAHAPPSLA